MAFNSSKLKWVRQPKEFYISSEKIEIITEPYTDLWQKTYYGFQNDNAPILQLDTEEKFFTFVVKTQFESKKKV